MNKSKDKKGGKLRRLILKARDMYTKGMSKCAERVEPCDPFSNHRPSSSDTDLRILIQEAELRRSRSYAGPVESSGSRGVERVTRSRSAMQISRIDEESTCEFEEDAKSRQFLIPRSISFALEAKRRRSRCAFEDRLYWRTVNANIGNKRHA